MSFVTTQPKMLRSVPSTSNARLPAGAHTVTPATALAWAAIGGWSGGVLGAGNSFWCAHMSRRANVSPVL
jgi:hypothetical protein